MLKEISNQVLPLIVNCVVSILGIIITIVGTHIINFIKLKNAELIKNMGISKYNSDKALALDIWNLVDEHFRIHQSIDNVIENKVKMFNDELKKKCPYITQEEQEFLRQTVAGEVNKCKRSENIRIT